MKKNGIGSHQSARSIKTEWLTPKELLDKLPEFDLDPCSPINRPWDIAKNHYTIIDNGLEKEWFGNVFCNPPYDDAAIWLSKLKKHGKGIALIFARTETKTFFNEVWNDANGILFIEGRLTFYHVTGEKASANSGAPSVLIAYGKANAEFLKTCDIKGKYLQIKF